MACSKTHWTLHCISVALETVEPARRVRVSSPSTEFLNQPVKIKLLREIGNGKQRERGRERERKKERECSEKGRQEGGRAAVAFASDSERGAVTTRNFFSSSLSLSFPSPQRGGVNEIHPAVRGEAQQLRVESYSNIVPQRQLNREWRVKRRVWTGATGATQISML